MKISPSLFSRYDLPILCAFAFVTPALLHFAALAVSSNKNNVSDWLPTSYDETADLRWFRENFRGDNFVVVSWQGCELGLASPKGDVVDDPRLQRLADALSEIAANGDAAVPQVSIHRSSAVRGLRWCTSVVTGRQLLDQLTAGRMGVPYADAVRRLTGIVIGPNGRQTCAMVHLSDEAIPHFREILGHGGQGILGRTQPEGRLFSVLRKCDIDPTTVHLAGPPVDNVAIDEEGERTLVRLAGYACLAGFVLAGISLRSVTLTLIVFACGVLSALFSLSLVWLAGETTDAILMSMPALVYVLAVSGAVHIVNYYRTEVAEVGQQYAAGRAVQHAWRPSILCAVTTALGLLSLYASELKPIRKFGIFSALGVLLTLIVLFLFLPAALSMWMPIGRKAARPRDADAKSRQQLLADTRAKRACYRQAIYQSQVRRVCLLLVRHHRAVVGACTAMAIILGLGISRVHTSIDLMKLFSADTRVIRDYRWLEANLGRLVPMEIVIKFPPRTIRNPARTDFPQNTLSLLDRMELVDVVQRTIEDRFGPGNANLVGLTLSPVRFVPSLPQSSRGIRAVGRRAAFNSQLEENYQRLAATGYLRVDPSDNSELWRISVRVAAFQGVDYGTFTNQIKELVDPVLARAIAASWDSSKGEGEPLPADDVRVPPPHELESPIQVVYTGVVPIVYKAQRALLESLVQSTIWSFVTITPLLMFVSRGVRAGCVAMLPNALPVVAVFGGMGWLGLPVDIGSMMSASIALGVAVDDTIHYLTWFRKGLEQSTDRRTAITLAYERCAAPTLQSALISGVGLSVFALSTFTPTRQFGYLMLTILVAGVVAELIMLPALLASPMGRYAVECRTPRGSLQAPCPGVRDATVATDRKS